MVAGLSEIGEGIKQKKKKNLIDTDNSMIINRGKGWEGQVKESKWGQMVMEEDMTLDGERKMQYTDGVLQN